MWSRSSALQAPSKGQGRTGRNASSTRGACGHEQRLRLLRGGGEGLDHEITMRDTERSKFIARESTEEQMRRAARVSPSELSEDGGGKQTPSRGGEQGSQKKLTPGGSESRRVTSWQSARATTRRDTGATLEPVPPRSESPHQYQ